MVTINTVAGTAVLACYADAFKGLDKGLEELFDAIVYAAIVVGICAALGGVAGLLIGGGAQARTTGRRAFNVTAGGFMGTFGGVWVGFFGGCAFLGLKVFLSAL